MERIAGLREYVTCKQYRSALGLPDWLRLLNRLGQLPQV